MAIGWLTVLKMVPWGDVIENAPKVAQGAKKLWHTVGRRRPAIATPTPGQDISDAPSPTMAQLQSQVAELQLATAELHQQMLDSSALIQSLAEQNTQLIKRVEVNRLRVVWLAAAMLVLVAVLVAVLAVKLF